MKFLSLLSVAYAMMMESVSESQSMNQTGLTPDEITHEHHAHGFKLGVKGGAEATVEYGKTHVASHTGSEDAVWWHSKGKWSHEAAHPDAVLISKGKLSNPTGNVMEQCKLAGVKCVTVSWSYHDHLEKKVDGKKEIRDVDDGAPSR